MTPRALAMLRSAALLAAALGAICCIALMLYTARSNPSRLLLALFTAWVSVPFLLTIWCNLRSLGWSSRPRLILYVVTLALSFCSVAIYAFVALGPPRPKPAAFFLVVPLASLLALVIVVAPALSRGRANRP